MQSTPETKNYSDKIIYLLWGHAGESPDTMSKSIAKVGLVKSCICVNMVIGPMGHVGGMSMSNIRHDMISLFVTGTIPSNRFFANVVISIQRPDYSLASTNPFCISVKEKDTLVGSGEILTQIIPFMMPHRHKRHHYTNLIAYVLTIVTN